MSEMDVRGDAQAERTLDDDNGVRELSIETPEADAAEQHRDLRDDVREADSEARRSLPFDADPADAFEQSLTVDLDEDDYR
jgi:hypothetical protein